MASAERIVIAGAARTPLGSFQGKLKGLSAPALGAVAIEAALKRAGLDNESPDEVLMGCVLPAGLGQAPARQAAIAGGVPGPGRAPTGKKGLGGGEKAPEVGQCGGSRGAGETV